MRSKLSPGRTSGDEVKNRSTQPRVLCVIFICVLVQMGTHGAKRWHDLVLKRILFSIRLFSDCALDQDLMQKVPHKIPSGLSPR